MTRILAKYRERAYPYIGGSIAAIASWAYGPAVAGWAARHDVDVNGIFAAVFDVSAILTAFLFAFFGLAIAPGGGFIERIFRTKTFRVFLRYIGEALGLGLALTLGSVPFMVADIRPAADATLANIAVAGWAFVCVAAMLAFVRVASVFLIWIRARSGGSFRTGLSAPSL
jgi:hypothetical protein